MSDEQTRLTRLASLIGVTPDRLARHVMRPLHPPADRLADGWLVPSACRKVHSITNGFNLFGTQPWDGFRFWGTQDYDCCVKHGGPIFEQAVEGGLFPIYGSIPHLTSVSLQDGSVVSTDWECYGDDQDGWGTVIASDLYEYLRTLIVVREAYGYEEGHPSDWWSPYASHGTRFDRE